MNFREITEARYNEMLGLLPPALMTGRGFLLGEVYDQDEGGSPRYLAFFHMHGRFYQAEAPMTAAKFRQTRKGRHRTRGGYLPSTTQRVSFNRRHARTARGVEQSRKHDRAP